MRQHAIQGYNLLRAIGAVIRSAIQDLTVLASTRLDPTAGRLG